MYVESIENSISCPPISTADEVEPVLRDALAQTGPVLIDCHIDRDINVLPMVPAGASVESPILEMDN